jgi:dihydrofolate reductase
MSKTIYYTAASLDGYIADAANAIDWLMQFDHPDGGDYETFIRDVGAVAMGSTTYQWVLDNHVKPESAAPQPWPYDVPTWVFSSRRLRQVRGADVRLVSGDVRPVHADMVKAAGGRNVWLVGGGDLVGQFHDQGLLDEIMMTVAPVTLGRGAPLLPRTIATPPLQLVLVRQWGEHFVRLHYRVKR